MEQECVYDINELLLENPNLFTLSEQDALTTITTQLKVSLTHLRLPVNSTHVPVHVHGKVTALSVLYCCVALLRCLFNLACFIPSFSSLINTHCLLW